ncbi:MAG: hypothetical protein N4J56_005335 [Chroococcidiopsis sp. SAG 2025]|uniref:hypothetical protein n=1 Tax=Chroococcidiopsis sp. SAG 2025 TaxID=171389 RepID=UPI0029372A91|nr:hypothetical protein [Chroococcidiopsis sp. SAG 2025]MDV2995681.1 hypothetical protein [Chroococcidiopsis sp. SAG 2025]
MTKVQIAKQSPDKKTLSIPNMAQSSDRESKTYFLLAIALVIGICSAIIGGLLLDEYLKLFSTTQIDKGSHRDLMSVPPATKVPAANLVQTAFGNQVQVTIIAVKRIPGKPDEVNVEMQIEKLTDTPLIEGTISIGSTMASNSETSEVYRATDFMRRSSGRISLSKLRQNKPIDAYVVLDVPQGVTTIDLFVDQTTPFKNVPIAAANPFTRVVSRAATSSKTAMQATGSLMMQPNGLIRKALDNKAQVQVISAQRLNNPELATRNLVNVKMRIWRLGTKQPNFQDVITVSATTARNPETSETYRAFDFLNRATNPVFLFYLRPQTYTDAYVWLQVPEGVNTLDLFIPETGTFRNVPISQN